MIELSVIDLALAASLVLLLALVSMRLHSNISRQLIIASIRTALQLTLIGLVLKVIFENVNFGWIMLLSILMLLIAGREVIDFLKDFWRWS